MPNITLSQSAIDLIAIIFVLVFATLLIAFVTVMVRRQPATTRPLTVDTVSLSEAIERIKDASAHAANVSAVLSLMSQLEDNPDALELIKSYPETVRAAAWLHYINTLGADLQAAQVLLSHAHRGTGPYQYVSDLPSARKSAQAHVDDIRAKLDFAVKASGQSGLRAVTS